MHSQATTEDGVLSVGDTVDAYGRRRMGLGK